MTGTTTAPELAGRIAQVRSRIAAAAAQAGRDPQEVSIVAVTKGQPASAVAAALECGLCDIGESRVQEATAKRAATAGAATWHLIGHLQRNKAAAAAAMFDVVQSVDSAAVARALDAHREPVGTRLRVLVEVDLTGIATRTGVPPSGAADLLGTLLGLPRLWPTGLMTIAPPGPPAAARACFAQLRGLRDELEASHRHHLPDLSMGMSDDFEAAVMEGATIVRLGRVLFGERRPGGTATAHDYPEAAMTSPPAPKP